MKTQKIKKILIALDYGDSSIEVAEIGDSMAQALRAETILVHVVYEQPIYYSSYNSMRMLHMDVIDDLKLSTQKFLDNAVELLGDPNIKTVLKEGRASHMILETAKEMNADLIVMGSHSRNWFDNLIMGSETEDVMKQTSIPLLVVPTREKE